MQRITITIDDDLMAEVERFMQMRGYEARSEVFRDLLRRAWSKPTKTAAALASASRRSPMSTTMRCAGSPSVSATLGTSITTWC